MQLTVAGRSITLEREPMSSSSRWRLLVDDAPIAMTFRETESVLGNTGTRVKELAPAAPADWIRLPDLTDVSFHVSRSSEGGWFAHCAMVTDRTEIYNTVVYSMESLSIRIPDDFGVAHVTWDHHLDMSD